MSKIQSDTRYTYYDYHSLAKKLDKDWFEGSYAKYLKKWILKTKDTQWESFWQRTLWEYFRSYLWTKKCLEVTDREADKYLLELEKDLPYRKDFKNSVFRNMKQC